MKHGLPEPLFEEISGSLVVSFRKIYTLETLEKLGLNERQIKVLEYVNEKGKITNRDFKGMFPEISAETARLDLNDLVKKKVLDKKGEKRGAYYVIK